MKRLIAASACALVAVMAPGAADAADVAPFRIGVLNDQSSAYAVIGGKGSQVAVEMAVADFGGKVLGRPIEVLSADHQNKVDVAIGIAREWIESKDVQAIFDLANSGVALAVIPLVEKANRVAIVSSGASSEITGKACTPVSFQWTYDTWSISRVLPKALVKLGKKSWYLMNYDYTAGAALENDVSSALGAYGGKIAGKVRLPLGATNYSSALLTAQNSGADVIMLGGGGADMINQVKQAKEFGLNEQMALATPFATVLDVHSLGLANAQGLYASEAFYWDLTPETRAWSKRFVEKRGVPATMYQAGNYSAALHYLKAVAAAKTSDGRQVAKAMKATRVNDMMTKNAEIRADGRLVRDQYVFRVKSPAQSKYPFDYFELMATVPGAEAVRPLAESACPLVKR